MFRMWSRGLVLAVLACSSTTDGRIGNGLLNKLVPMRIPRFKHMVTLRGGADDLDWLNLDDTKPRPQIATMKEFVGPWGDEQDDGNTFLQDGSLPELESDEREQEGLPRFDAPDSQGNYDVLLRVYDLTLGGIRNVSAMYPDEPKIHGVWQLGICVHGREWTYCAYKGDPII
jgi:hypothetical protein